MTTNLTSIAYAAASKAADEIVKTVVNDLIIGLSDGSVDPDDMTEAVSSACDSALIYTADQYACAWGLPDPEIDPISDIAMENWQDALSVRAYYALRSEVEFHPDLQAAIEVASDAKLAQEEAS